MIMRKNIILWLFLLMPYFLSAQDEKPGHPADPVVRQGIYYHESGQYQEAINIYEIILEEYPDYSMVIYEMAYSYFGLKEYDKCIELCDQVLALPDEDGSHVMTYTLKGSSENTLGNSKKAIATFKEAIKKFPSGSHLLYYNLALTYCTAGENEKAIEPLAESIRLNPGHANSHRLLGSIMGSMGRPTEALYCYYYYLLLRPDADNSGEVLQLIRAMLPAHIVRMDDNTFQVKMSASIYDRARGDEMSRALEAIEKTTDQYPDINRTVEGVFAINTGTFFQYLGPERLVRDIKKSIWQKFYKPFFREMYEKDLVDIFCHYILSPESEVSMSWLLQQTDKVNELNEWYENYHKSVK